MRGVARYSATTSVVSVDIGTGKRACMLEPAVLDRNEVKEGRGWGEAAQAGGKGVGCKGGRNEKQDTEEQGEGEPAVPDESENKGG